MTEEPVTRAQAAGMFVTSWCLNHGLLFYLHAVTGIHGELDEVLAARVHELFPWLTPSLEVYIAGHPTVCVYVARNLPKLNAWLFAQPSNEMRMRAVPQIEKLVCKRTITRSGVTDPERQKTRADYYKAMNRGLVVSEIKNSNQRGAWNVCKGPLRHK